MGRSRQGISREGATGTGHMPLLKFIGEIFLGFQAQAGLTNSKQTKKNGVLLSSVEVLSKVPTKGGPGRQERLTLG